MLTGDGSVNYTASSELPMCVASWLHCWQKMPLLSPPTPLIWVPLGLQPLLYALTQSFGLVGLQCKPHRRSLLITAPPQPFTRAAASSTSAGANWAHCG